MSVDKEQRQALRFLDGLRTVAEMMQLESDEQSSSSNEQYCSMIRTYFEKADDPDKALLCSMKPFMMALVAQLQSPGDDLTQSQSSVASKTPNESKEVDANCYETDSEKNSSNMSFEREEEAEKLQATLNESHSSLLRQKNVSNSAQWQGTSNSEVASGTKLSTSDDEYSDITKKIQDISLDDVDSQEQPVNYSLKYPEESSTPSNFSPHQSKRKFNLSPKSEANVSQEEMYNAYAETDLDNLDQPTDYSQKYHEYIQDDCPPSIHFNRPSPSHPLKESCKLSCSYEDTIKVFCTEDTPLNFSSASSLTDLRDVGLSGLQTPNSCFDESLEKSPEMTGVLKEATTFRNCSTDVGNGFLSTVEENDELSKDNRTGHGTNITATEEMIAKNDGEASVDETPLMFSRSSSLCSLNSFEQQSIHDDRSSVSDFSHVPSGVVSPSDLPDSPLCYTPKVFKVEDTPVVFSFCDSVSPLQSGDQSIMSTNGKSTVNDVTLKYSPNCINSFTNCSILEENSQQQHTSPNRHPLKSDLPHFSEHATMKQCMRMSNNAISPESRDQQSFTTNRLSYPNSTRIKHFGKMEESTFSAQDQEMAEKALIEQYISLGMPTKHSVKTTPISLVQIGKSTTHNQVHQQPPDEPTLSSPKNYISHTSPQVFRETLESPNVKMDVSESATPLKNDCQKLLKTNISKKCEITPSEKALLEEYILFGMPRNAGGSTSPKLQQTTRPQAPAVQSPRSSPSHFKSLNNHTLPNNITSQAAASPLKIQTEGSSESSKTSTATARMQVLNPSIDVSGLSASDRAMLNEVISLGMPEHKSKIR